MPVTATLPTVSVPVVAIPPATAVVTLGVGVDGIVVSLSEDAYQGDAQFTIAVDGKQIGGTQTATASRAAGQSQSFALLGSFGGGTHSVTATFLNDAYGGTASTDRNLYVDSVTAGGIKSAVNAALMSSGSTSFSAALPASNAVTVGSGSETASFLVSPKTCTRVTPSLPSQSMASGSAALRRHQQFMARVRARPSLCSALSGRHR